MTKRDLSFIPTAAAAEGAQHRMEVFQEARPFLPEETTKAPSTKKKPGPSKAFGGVPLRRLNAFMPEDLSRRINAEAVQAGQTVGEYLAARLYGGEVSKERDPKQS